MGKLVVLKLGEGSFEQGFPVTFQLGAENARPSTEVTGKLPPDPELPQYYQQWQLAYRGLGLRSRLSAPDRQIKNVSIPEDCEQAARQLRDRFNLWLEATSFRAIREKWLEKLASTDTIRVILQTETVLLQKLPWHLWDLMERYSNAEIAFSTPAFEQVSSVAIASEEVSVLAILGNSQGIDTEADQALLKQLPDANVHLLVEPSRQEVSDRLWEQHWDILFFAGHSSSHNNGETGRIYINQTDSLTIGELKFALRKAVAQGLQLAIFNSCDGLGLARELADLHIPQVIVMREPVPDQVAQAFLKYFLHAFAHGEPLYQAVRQARERLQSLEDQFPCATWLPIIYQNPAELPPTWEGLRGERQEAEGRRQKAEAEGDAETRRRGDAETIQNSKFKIQNPLLTPPSITPSSHHPIISLTRHPKLPTLAAVFVGVVVTALVAGVRYLGGLQSAELRAFDQILRLRPEEGADSRLLIVTISDEDIQFQRRNQEPLKGTSLSDRSLTKLLLTLKKYQPRVIGLDLYRDFPVDRSQPALTAQLRQTENLVGICKVSDTESDRYGIAPPTEIPVDRIGFSDFIQDQGKTVRRQILFMTPEPGSPCLASYAFSVQLAARYLAVKGINPTFTSNKDLQLGDTVFQRIQGRTAGYQVVETSGSQVLLNYRAAKQIAASVSLTQILTGQVDPSAVKDKIIIIGVTADSSSDKWRTPYTSDVEVSGVFIQAQMLSQMLSTVLDRRPLIWMLPQSGELLWILGWSVAGALLTRSFRSRLYQGIAIATAAGILFAVCYVTLLHGGWLPLIPPLLALAIASASVATYTFYQNRLTQRMSIHQE